MLLVADAPNSILATSSSLLSSLPLLQEFKGLLPFQFHHHIQEERAQGCLSWPQEVEARVENYLEAVMDAYPLRSLFHVIIVVDLIFLLEVWDHQAFYTT